MTAFYWVTVRADIFRQKNYSAEFGTSRNRRQFRRNSACFAEEKNLVIPFRNISRKRKTLGTPFQTISRKRNTLGIPFRTIYRKRKTIRIPFWTISRKRKPLGIPFRTIFGWEKPRNSIQNHFLKRRTSKFRSESFSEKKQKNFGIPFRIIFGREKLRKKTTFVSCFVKLQYFVEFRSVPFCSELQNGLFRNTQNHT
jgi:hypothetical protein